MKAIQEIPGTTLAGALYIVAGAEVVLWSFGFDSIPPIPHLESRLPYYSALFVAMAYVAGRMVDPLILFAGEPVAAFLDKFSPHYKLRQTPGVVGHSEDNVLVYQYGSPALIDELNRHWSNSALFRALVPAFLAFGICTCGFLRSTPYAWAAWPVLLWSIGISAAMLLSYFGQIEKVNVLIRQGAHVAPPRASRQ